MYLICKKVGKCLLMTTVAAGLLLALTVRAVAEDISQLLRPGHPDVLYGLARLHIAHDELEAAETLLRQLTEATPEFEGGHVLLANVYYRQNKRQLGDRERAIVEELKAKRKENEPPVPVKAGPPGAEQGESR